MKLSLRRLGDQALPAPGRALLLRAALHGILPAAVDKFAQVWDLIPGADQHLSNEEKSHALVAWFSALVKELKLPDNLETLGIAPDNIPDLVDGALNVQRLMKNVPCTVSAADVQSIYQTLFPQGVKNA